MNRERCLVVGVGTPDRRDDAVGLRVTAAVRPRLAPDVALVELATPLDLLEVLGLFETVVVVDAVRSDDGAPGTVTVTLASDEELPVLPGSGGTHGMGLAETVELARALDRLPRRLVVVGVEADLLDLGCGLSPAVADAVARAADEVVRMAGTSWKGGA